MKEWTKIILALAIGTILGLFIASNIWLHWRVSNVERTASQIVQFLNQPKQAAQQAQPEQTK